MENGLSITSQTRLSINNLKCKWIIYSCAADYNLFIRFTTIIMGIIITLEQELCMIKELYFHRKYNKPGMITKISPGFYSSILQFERIYNECGYEKCLKTDLNVNQQYICNVVWLNHLLRSKLCVSTFPEPVSMNNSWKNYRIRVCMVESPDSSVIVYGEGYNLLQSCS